MVKEKVKLKNQPSVLAVPVAVKKLVMKQLQLLRLQKLKKQIKNLAPTEKNLKKILNSTLTLSKNGR